MNGTGSRKEHTMTDWDLITEQIQNAMQAVDRAHEASENLRNHATPEAFDEFKDQMRELYYRALERGKIVARNLLNRFPRFDMRRIFKLHRLPKLRIRRLAMKKSNQVCPDCSRVSAKDAEFCQYCGRPLGEIEV